MFWYEQYIGFVIEPLIIKDIVNPPNLITLIRIILTGVVMLLLFNQSYGLAVIIFIIASFLDLIDGPMARALGMITNTGKMLDPLADKILLASVLIPLGYHNLPSWLFLVHCQLGVISYYYRHNKNNNQAFALHHGHPSQHTRENKNYSGTSRCGSTNYH